MKGTTVSVFLAVAFLLGFAADEESGSADRMTLVRPCGTTCARRRHLARGETCVRCGANVGPMEVAA